MIKRYTFPLLALGYLVAAYVVFPKAWVSLSTLFLIKILLAHSINVTGLSGQVSLGHGAFYAIGAYGSGLLMTKLGVPFWLSLPLAVTLTAVFGYLVSLPAGKVEEFYLALVSFSVGIVVWQALQVWKSLTGGFTGLKNIPSPTVNTFTLFGFNINDRAYHFILGLVVICVSWFLWNLFRSHIGRALVMVAEESKTATALGINTGQYKRLAWVLSAAIAGIAGVFYAHFVTFLAPDSFSELASVDILVLGILGGMGSYWGPFLGALVLTVLPYALQAFVDLQLLLYGLVLFLAYQAFPKGLAGFLPWRTPFAMTTAGSASDDADSHPNNLQDGGQVSSIIVHKASHQSPQMSQADDLFLETKNLSIDFGGVRALSNVNFTIKKGTVHGLIGPNGAGKTTWVNILSGLYVPAEGSILYQGRDITKIPAHERLRYGISRTFQNVQLPESLTVLEAVMSGNHINFKSSLASTLFGKHYREELVTLEAAEALLSMLNLTDDRNKLTAELPYGKKRLTDLARALITNPDVLILDEPTAGVADQRVETLRELILSLKARGLTIVIIEHNMDFLLSVMDSVTVLDSGSVIFDGDPENMLRDERVQLAYLGGYTDAAVGS